MSAGKFVVIGGGNSSSIIAVLAKLQGYHVSILTRKPADWSSELSVKNDDKGYLGGVEQVSGTVDLITAKPEECIPEADIIFIAGLPVHLNNLVLREIKPHVNMANENLYIGTICGYGGFNWVTADELGSGAYKIFGCQLIPWCCGTDVYGKVGHIYGAKRFLRIATEDGGESAPSKHITGVFGKVLQMETRPTDFLSSLLWPNNPWIHPPILYGLFKDWKGERYEVGDGKDMPLKIYADLRQASGEALEVLNAELVAVCDKLASMYPIMQGHNFDLGHCIRENYTDQVTDGSSLFTTFTTNAAFSKHNIAYTKMDDGKSIPTIQHKFFLTDLPLGLCTYKDIACMLGMHKDTPLMDAIILWNQKLIDKEFLVPNADGTGTISGKDAKECTLPSAYGLDVKSLLTGRRQ